MYIPYGNNFLWYQDKDRLLRSESSIKATLSIKKLGVLLGSVVKCLTCNPRVLGLSCNGSSGFFSGSVLRQDTSEPQPSTGETQERHE